MALGSPCAWQSHPWHGIMPMTSRRCPRMRRWQQHELVSKCVKDMLSHVVSICWPCVSNMFQRFVMSHWWFEMLFMHSLGILDSNFPLLLWTIMPPSLSHVYQFIIDTLKARWLCPFFSPKMKTKTMFSGATTRWNFAPPPWLCYVCWMQRSRGALLIPWVGWGKQRTRRVLSWRGRRGCAPSPSSPASCAKLWKRPAQAWGWKNKMLEPWGRARKRFKYLQVVSRL